MLLSVAPKMKRRNEGDASAGMRRQRPRSGASAAGAAERTPVRRPAAGSGGSGVASLLGRLVERVVLDRQVDLRSAVEGSRLLFERCLGTLFRRALVPFDEDPAEVQAFQFPGDAVRVPDE